MFYLPQWSIYGDATLFSISIESVINIYSSSDDMWLSYSFSLSGMLAMMIIDKTKLHPLKSGLPQKWHLSSLLCYHHNCLKRLFSVPTTVKGHDNVWSFWIWSHHMRSSELIFCSIWWVPMVSMALRPKDPGDSPREWYSASSNKTTDFSLKVLLRVVQGTER